MPILTRSLVYVSLAVCPSARRPATAQGVEQVVARYHGSVAWDDAARRMALDSNTGNVYVAGHSQGVGTGVDSATVAYDSSGNQLWVARYDNGAALAIAADSNSGNVYVTGQSQGMSATIAYDSSGNQLWVALYQ